MFRLGGFPWVHLVGVLDELDAIFGRDAPIRVNEAGFKFLHAIAFDREPLVGEIVILPVVIADSNHLPQGQTVVDREDDEFGHQRSETELLPPFVTFGKNRRGIEDVREDAVAEPFLEQFRGHSFFFQECEEFGQLASGCVCFHVRDAV